MCPALRGRSCPRHPLHVDVSITPVNRDAPPRAPVEIDRGLEFADGEALDPKKCAQRCLSDVCSWVRRYQTRLRLLAIGLDHRLHGHFERELHQMSTPKTPVMMSSAFFPSSMVASLVWKFQKPLDAHDTWHPKPQM